MNEWAYAICMACVLAGGLELLMPRKEYETSIKVVVALYILVTVLQPLQSAVPGWDELWPEKESAAVDFSDYRSQLEQQALEEQLEQTLASQGISGQVQIVTGPPVTVTVICADPEQAEVILHQALGADGEIVIRAEESGNGT